MFESTKAIGDTGVPPTKVQVVIIPDPIGVNMKSRPRHTTPLPVCIVCMVAPRMELPIATGAVEIAETALRTDGLRLTTAFLLLPLLTIFGVFLLFLFLLILFSQTNRYMKLFNIHTGWFVFSAPFGSQPERTPNGTVKVSPTSARILTR